MTTGSVQMRIWRIPPHQVPAALLRVATGRITLRRQPGLRFFKLLGTGSGRTFTTSDADPLQWALLTVFDTPGQAADFERSRTVTAWRRMADEELCVDLRPLSSVGSWSGSTPFAVPVPHRWDGPVAAITRARIRTPLWRRFWSAVPPVAADLNARAGLVLSIGIGEAPVGLQGTFSLWRSNRDLTDFAYRSRAHRDAIEQTAQLQWYSEELFARFAVLDCRGTLNAQRPLEDLATR